MRFALRLIAIVCLLAARITAEPRALSEGITLVGAGNYTAAILALQPLAEESRGDSVLQYWLGRAYYGQRNYRIAAQHLAVAADHDTGNEDACYWHARALRMAGDYPAALAAYTAYAARFRHNDNFLIETVYVHALSNDLRGAQKIIDQLWARTPPAQRGRIDNLRRLLEAAAAQEYLEPPLARRTDHFTLCYTPIETMTTPVLELVEDARAQISQLTGMPVSGFRVLLFADRDAYMRYASILLPDHYTLHAVAFSSPGLLTMYSPAEWPRDRRDADTMRQIITHEIAHLAILQRTRGEGMPLWLHEGMACYFSGWGGMQTGEIPARPMTLARLERSFILGGADTTPAYAQAHGMVSAMARQLAAPGLFKLIDLLADGVPLPIAYHQLCDESWNDFMAQWTQRLQETAAQPPAGR